MLNEMVGNKSSSGAVHQAFHIKTAKKDFVRCLSHAQTVVERRNIVPILSNILLVVKDNILTVTATDMDIIFSEQLPVEVIQSGAVTVSAQLLYDIVRKLDDSSGIELLLSQNNTLEISSENCKFTLGTLPVKEFPVIEDEGYELQFNLPALQFKDAIDKVKFSISTEETRYNLNGVFFHSSEDNILKVVSTDGHRLSMVNIPDVQGVKAFEGVIIPRKAVLELRKVVEELEGEISISLSSNKVKFVSQNFMMVTKLIDAKFPSYESLIPKENDIVVNIEKEKFVKSIDRVSTINNEKFRGIKLDFSNNELILTSSGDAGGAAKEVISYKSDSDAEVNIGFNSRYLLEVVSILETDEVVCHFKDSFSPVIISEVSDENYKHILMPMRV